MARLETKTQVTMTASVELTAEEIYALAELTSYGLDSFIEILEKNVSERLVKNHGAGLRSFFSSIAAPASTLKRQHQEMMGVFRGTHKAVQRTNVGD